MIWIFVMENDNLTTNVDVEVTKVYKIFRLNTCYHTIKLSNGLDHFNQVLSNI